MRSMNTALWQVGWGYFLSNMIGTEAGLTRLDLEWARRHFLDHVRSFGPLPAFRCGAQPYGLLPVTSLDLWQPGPDAETQDTWLKGMLARPARQRLAPGGGVRGADREPRGISPDPDADLADVMRTDALSSGYRTRNVFGRHFLQHLQRFVGSRAWRTAIRRRSRSCSSSASPMAAQAVADVECRLASNAVLVAGAAR